MFSRRRHGFRDQPAAPATLLCAQNLEEGLAPNRCLKKVTIEGIFE